MKIDTTRSTYRLFQGARMIVHCLIMSLPAVLIWRFLYRNGWMMTPVSSEPFINHIGPFAGIGHFFLIQIISNLQAKKDLVMAANLPNNGNPGNKAEYLRLARLLPVPMNFKIAVFATAVIVELLAMSIHYGSYPTGLAAVLGCAFILSMVWEMIADTENPIRGVSVTQYPPGEWLREIETALSPRLTDRVYDRIYWLFFMKGR
jgi:hypothetical protein